MIKILAIGNSFSEDATRHLFQIAQNLNIGPVILGNLHIGGCSLERHWNNACDGTSDYLYFKNSTGDWLLEEGQTLLHGLQDEAWDIITMQQASGYSGVAKTYEPYLGNLLAYVQKNKRNPHAKLGWHMTWAYQQDTNHADFPNYGSDQQAMYNAIVAAVQENILPNPAFDFVIPAGTMIQNIRTSRIGDTITRDGYHLSYNLGRYAAGLVWTKTITGCSIDPITWVPDPKEITADDLIIVKEAVNNAAKTPFAITQSSYTKK